MKKRILQAFMVAILFLPATLMAQEGNPSPATMAKMPKKTPEQKATSLTDTLNSIVSLSTDQYQKAYASNLKYVTTKEDARKNSSDFQAAKTQIMAATKTRKSEIAAILTPEQVTKWEAWKQERRAKMGSKKEQFMQNHPNSQKWQNNSQNQQPMPIDDIDGM